MPPIDEPAFDRLYEAHAGQVAAFVLRRCQRDDAADIVSETFLVAWRRRDEIPSEPMTRAWLYGVARRVAANHHRGTRRRNRLTERVSSQIATALRTTPDPQSWRAEAGELTEALIRLSAEDRELLFLTAWEELTPAEIAQVLDLPARVVHKRLHRARRRLQALLQPGGGQSGGQDQTREEAGVDVR
ncbi:MAG: RNA polymerase sigma factor [Actinomycetota bacterium]